MCTTGDTEHIDTILKLLPQTCQRVWQELEYRFDVCRVTHGAHIEHFQLSKKKLFHFSCGCEKFHYGRSFGFLVINVCNHGEYYETPCILTRLLPLFVAANRQTAR